MAKRTLSSVFHLYSPRWGHTDTYTVSFDEGGITVSHGENKAHWTESPGRWTGYKPEGAWLAIMRSDSIHAPEAVETGITSIWQAWIDEDMSDADVHVRLSELAAWIDAITAAKPRGDFWGGVF